MDYAKAVGTKSNKEEGSLQQSHGYKQQSHGYKSQETSLDVIRNIRKSQVGSSRKYENDQGSYFQRPQKFVSIIGRLSNKLKSLKILEKEETLEEKKERLKHTLLRFDSPFIWKPIYSNNSIRKESVLSMLQEKDDEIVDENEFKWRNFILQLIISYELFLADRLSEAHEVVCELEKTLIKHTGCHEWLFLGIKNALWHVISSSKAFLYLEQNKLVEAEQMIDRVQPVHTMKKAARAGIHGIRAAVFMEYGLEGNLKALPEAKKASELDTTSPEWHFLVAKTMGRIRRVTRYHDPVDVLEITSINKAVKRDQNNPLYKVYLAQTIREQAFRLYKQDYPKIKSKGCKKLDKAFTAAFYHYMEAKEMQPNCPHILTRCAYGVMKLPIQFINLKFVRESLEKAIELAPKNLMAHHIMGLYHERFGIEVEDAIKELMTAASLGNSSAAFDLVRIRYRLGKGDPVAELTDIVSSYNEPMVNEKAYTQAGSFLLFIEYDLIGALTYFTRVMDINSTSYAMKSHKSLFLRMKDPVNLFQLLLVELDQNTKWGTFSREDNLILRKFRLRLMEHDSPENKENKLTVDKIIEMSRNLDKEDLIKKSYLSKRKTQKSTIWTGYKRKLKCKKTSNCKKICTKNKNDTLLANTQENLNSIETCNSLKQGQRSRSVTSVSSVDSDYERDSRLYGPRGFFINSDKNNLNEPTSNPIRHSSSEGEGFISRERFSENMIRLYHSRASSTCSEFSEDELGGRPSDLQIKSTSISRCFSQMSISNKSEDDISLISSSAEKLKLSESHDLMLRPSKPSVSCMKLNNTDKPSVMERVNQSYAMLNRPFSRDKKSQQRNLRRTESFQSINKPNKKLPIQRIDSTQSLNIEIESVRKLVQHYEPFGSQNSTAGSNHSFTFLPHFAQNKN